MSYCAKRPLWKIKSVCVTVTTFVIISDLISSHITRFCLCLQVSLEVWVVLSVCSFLGCSTCGKGSWRCRWTAGQSVRSHWVEPASLSHPWNTPTPARCTSCLSLVERYFCERLSVSNSSLVPAYQPERDRIPLCGLEQWYKTSLFCSSEVVMPGYVSSPAATQSPANYFYVFIEIWAEK